MQINCVISKFATQLTCVYSYISTQIFASNNRRNFKFASFFRRRIFDFNKISFFYCVENKRRNIYFASNFRRNLCVTDFFGDFFWTFSTPNFDAICKISTQKIVFRRKKTTQLTHYSGSVGTSAGLLHHILINISRCGPTHCTLQYLCE